MAVELNRPAKSFRASRLHRVEGIIARRLLVNFRADPEFVQRILPAPFRPKQVDGWSIVGICLIRLEAIRPCGLPTWLGVSSENIAHRIAVDWDEDGITMEGVFIPCRHSNSKLNRWLGGRLFPGVHRQAEFAVSDDRCRVELEVDAPADRLRIRVRGTTMDDIPLGSVFGSLEDAAAFFRGGAVGWSPARDTGTCEGLELCAQDWTLVPFQVEEMSSSYFQDRRQFPVGTCEFDSAFLMRNVQHVWRTLGRIRDR